jgi:hypothetical protein
MPRVNDVMSKDPKPTIGIYSYGVKGSARPTAQFDFDVSKWRDPSGQKQFAGRTSGQEPEVRDWAGEDNRTEAVISACLLLANDLVKPHPRGNGTTTTLIPESAWLSFAFHDVHGRWAAPAIAELVADALDKAGYTVAVAHHGLKPIKSQVVL